MKTIEKYVLSSHTDEWDTQKFDTLEQAQAYVRIYKLWDLYT